MTNDRNSVPTAEHAAAMDRNDLLARFHGEFYLPDGRIYLDGNSLGAMPLAAQEIAGRVIRSQWAEHLIDSWNRHDWFRMPQRLGNLLAPLIGAETGEVVFTDSVSVNLFKIVSAALAMRPDRHVIVMEGSNFPNDNYMVQGLVEMLGGRHTLRFVEADEIQTSLTNEVALVCLTDVHYKTGAVLDMHEITGLAHDAGALALWDLCHSAGVLPIELNRCAADFAVGCSYKYLNGGPGSPAFVYMAGRHHGSARQPLTGWWGHRQPFEFERDYQAAPGIGQMLSGTQPIVSMAMTEAGIEMAVRAGIHAIRDKSVGLTEFFIRLIDGCSGRLGWTLVSPRRSSRRGSQVAYSHPHGYAIVRALHARGLTADFRAPDIMRFGFAPLYTRFIDVWNAAEVINEVMQSGQWKLPGFQVKQAVT